MPSDAELLRAHHDGDRGAFAALLRRHADWMFAVARRRTGDAHAAEDVLQAAALALAARRPEPKEASVAPSLFGVVCNLSAIPIQSHAVRCRKDHRQRPAWDASTFRLALPATDRTWRDPPPTPVTQPSTTHSSQDR